MEHRTPHQHVADVLLGEPVENFIAARRPQRSWRLLARDLYDATDGRVDVTPESVRSWHVEAQTAGAA